MAVSAVGTHDVKKLAMDRHHCGSSGGLLLTAFARELILKGGQILS